MWQATTFAALAVAVIAAVFAIWPVVADAPWESESSPQTDPVVAGAASPTPGILAGLDSAARQRECDAIEGFFSEKFGSLESLLGIPVDVSMSRWLPAARECFTESKVHGLFRAPAEFWLTSQSNVPAELHPQLLEPTMSWLAGEKPANRTDALNEMAAIIRLYYVSHPTAQVVFAVQPAPSTGGFTSTDLRILDLERDIRRLNLEIDVLDLR